MLIETVRLAFRSIRRNVLRSFLTLLGVVIGVAAVIAMITIGNGTTQRVKDDIAKLGSNLLVVYPARPDRAGSVAFSTRTFDEKDVVALKNGLTNAKAVAPTAQKQVRVIYGAQNVSASVTGTDTDYFIARDWDVSAGRLFTDSEARGGAGVCLLGTTVRDEFFGAGDPLGQSIRVDRMSCRVIGVLASKGFTGFGQDQDNVVMMPLLTYQRRVAGNRNIDNIQIAAADGFPTSDVQADIEAILRESRRVAPGADDNFGVRDMTQVAETMASATTVMTGMLGALASVSLLVGGIGIMNIMLVSVTERTREIGIRLAIGAHEKHILLQFLVEATVLSLLGGILGILIGLGIAAGAASALAIPFVPSLPIILVAVGFSALIGMVFGFFPALRGARLNLIDALRHE